MKKLFAASLLMLGMNVFAQNPTPTPEPVVPTPTPPPFEPVFIEEEFAVTADVKLKRLGRDSAEFELKNISGDISQECLEVLEENSNDGFTYFTSFEPTFDFLQKSIRKGRPVNFTARFQNFIFFPGEEFSDCSISDIADFK